jgi:uncharacterized membrane protein
MDPVVNEWLNLLLRWGHVFAGILWIGSTYYFTWLDGRIHDEKENPGGKVWMVHSGGFYEVAKRKAPDTGSGKLHWFRWEAAITWLSGVLLLGVVYHMGGALVDKDVLAISDGMGSLIALGVLVAGWLVYDLLWLSPIGKNEVAGAVISYALLVGVTYALTRVFASRAAYIHVGALMGTLMAANVWLRILPAQRQMIAATNSGGVADARLAARAKGRSKHNTFMVVPVVFIMISNHFPVATYGSQHNWIILAVLILVGWVAAKFLRH